ncbi:XisH family protein [Dactylococcopsis salina]|uniref:XisH family protein n=1 Tax=Dactylococcopsis salina TaxID=292566 RepID=UPI001E3D2371|nr:XisH family protein [Dactylococcopsis salina]
MQYKEVRLLADLAGEKAIAATKEEQKVVIEVKSFVGRSPMREFQTALGQYLIYRTFIEQTHADYKIYLAVNQDIYDQFFQQIAIQLILTTYQLLLLIVDLNTEEVRRWIN